MPIEQARRVSQDDLIAALEHAGAQVVNPKKIRCPFHDDRNPSSWVYERTDGAWAFHCAPCGIDEDVYGVEDRAGVPRAQGSPSAATASQPVKATPDKDKASKVPEKRANEFLSLSEMEQATRTKRICTLGGSDGKQKVWFEAKLMEVYKYTNPDTNLLDMAVFRWEGVCEGKLRKDIMPAKPLPGGRWTWGAPEVRPIYNRLRLRTAAECIIVEGEKCVHALTRLGFIATTSPGGSEVAHKADWSPLAQMQRVHIWPDHDKENPKTGKIPGQVYAEGVARELAQVCPAAEVLWIDPASLGLDQDGSDVCDYIEALRGREGGAIPGKEDLKIAVELALGEGAYKPRGPDRLTDHLVSIIDGKWKALHWPHYMLGLSTNALYPGAPMLIGGEGGKGKSLFVRDCMRFWIEQGVSMASFELEDDKEQHLKRSLAQLAGVGGCANADYIRHHPQDVLAYRQQFKRELDILESSMDEAPDEEVMLLNLIDWVEAKCKKNVRLLTIDPVTAAVVGRESWNDERKFVHHTKALLRQYGASMIGVTHPRGGKKPGAPAMEDIAGSQAWPRFMPTLLYFSSLPETETLTCRGNHGASEEKINRFIDILKARNGFGTGLRLGFFFDEKTFRFHEQGLVKKENKRGR